MARSEREKGGGLQVSGNTFLNFQTSSAYEWSVSVIVLLGACHQAIGLHGLQRHAVPYCIVYFA